MTGGKTVSAVQQELLDQLEKLDERQQRQVLEYARALTAPQQAPWEQWEQWLAHAAQAQAELRAKYGDRHFFESQSALDAVREERLDDLMGRP
jgi:hypothetical protein